MTTPPLGDTLQSLLAGTRHIRATMPQKERAVLAAALLCTAVAVAWPTRTEAKALTFGKPTRAPGIGRHRQVEQ